MTHFATKQILELEQDKLIQKHQLLYNCSIEIDMFSEIGSSCYWGQFRISSSSDFPRLTTRHT